MNGGGDAGTWRSRRWPTHAAAGCTGAAVVLLLGAAGFGRFSRSWATKTPLPVRNLVWDSSTPTTTAWLAMVAGVAVCAVVVVALFAHTWILTACVAVGAVLVVFAYGALGGGLLPNYRAMTTAYTPAQQVPSALAAWLFAVAGAVAAAAGALMFIARPRVVAWLSVAAGAVAGVVAVLGTSSLIMRDADPGRYFDATTAADTPMPAIPAAFGTAERFTVRLDSPPEAEANARNDIWRTVRAAGSGFVVRMPDGVLAFDSAGQERWHYQHSGQPRWQAQNFGVFDDGATVVVGFDSGAHEAGEVVGLDAITGKLLWRSADPSVVIAVEDFAAPNGVGGDAPFYLVVSNGSGLTRIDTRTGEDMWSTDLTYPHMYLAFDTEAGVGYFTGESSNAGAEMRYVSLDPRAGGIRFDVSAGTYRWGDRAEDDGWPQVIDARHAGRNGIVFTDGDRRVRYLDSVTGDSSLFDTSELLGAGSADEFLAQTATPHGSTVTVREQRDGRIRCSMPTGVVAESAGWLGEEVLIAHRGGVSAYRRSDCSQLPGTAPRVHGGSIVVAPGVVLIIDSGPDSTTITGYA